MKWFYKLERKCAKYAIPNLTRYLIGIYAVGVLYMMFTSFTNDASAGTLLYYLTLLPELVMQGQVWRLVTWVLLPPYGFNLFFIFALLLYYWIGTSLEQLWGDFRYNLYIFFGLFMNTLTSMLIYWITGYSLAPAMSYLYLTLFLAFALTNPNERIYVYFIIPVKMKWLAWLNIIFLAYEFIVANYLTGVAAWSIRASILASVSNFLIFYFVTGSYKKLSPQEAHRRAKYKRKVHTATQKKITKHHCAVCGRSEETDPHLDFRFCSKCNGNYEYCNDHLFSHSHVK